MQILNPNFRVQELTPLDNNCNPNLIEILAKLYVEDTTTMYLNNEIINEVEIKSESCNVKWGESPQSEIWGE